MRMLTFASRTAREILRDPLNLAFGLGFPIILLLLLTAIQANIPVSLFEIGQLVPGIAVFGLSFVTLFAATLLAKDRGSALLQRLYTTPLTSADFIFGYTLPLLPIGIAQTLICYGCAIVLGLEVTANILLAVAVTVPANLFFIALGLLCGTIFSDKQVGGICGALLTNLCAWLSGTWFDLNLVGGAFKKIAYCLPFVHAVEMGRCALAGNFSEIMPHLAWALAYSAAMTAAAVIVYLHRMKHP